MFKSSKFKLRNAGIIFVILLAFSLPAFAQEGSMPIVKAPNQQIDLPLMPSPIPGNNISKINKNQTDADYAVIKEDFSLTTRDGIKLDCSRFYPNQPNIYLPTGYPVVIMVHGYGDRKETLENLASAQANYFYVVYTISMRGQGNSEGLSNLISRTEAKDLIDLVNYVRSDAPHTGADTAKISMMGGSQGGITPWMASCMGMNVKQIITSVASPEFATSWIENGSIKTTLLWTVSYTSDSARYAPEVDRIRNYIYSNTKKDWDSLAASLPRDRDFMNMVPQGRVPLLIENSWQDRFFSANGNIKALPLITVPYKAYFGAVIGHGGDTSHTETEWHKQYFNDWFNYWIWQGFGGWPANLLSRNKFDYASTKAPIGTDYMWAFRHDSTMTWPPAGITNNRYYFNKNGTLKLTPNNNNKDNVKFRNQISGGLTMEQAVDAEFKGADFDSKFKKDKEIFVTDPLAINMRMTGAPKIGADYESNAPLACQFNYQIWELFPDNTQHLVCRINYTDRAYNRKSTRKTAEVTGMPHSHIFTAGSRIKMVVTNLDVDTTDYMLRSNPHVLPVLNNSENTIYLSSVSYVDLPMQPYTGSMSRPVAIKKDNEIKLNDNYPNPFNPVTKISFLLPAGFNGLVTLKVYDIAGREISTLANDVMTSGLHDVFFDGKNISSGVYFYKLTAGNVNQVKRMMLIK